MRHFTEHQKSHCEWKKKNIDNTFVSAFSPKAVATAPVVAET